MTRRDLFRFINGKPRRLRADSVTLALEPWQVDALNRYLRERGIPAEIHIFIAASGRRMAQSINFEWSDEGETHDR